MFHCYDWQLYIPAYMHAHAHAHILICVHTDDNNVDFNSVLLFTYDSIFLLTATEYITKIAMLLG